MKTKENHSDNYIMWFILCCGWSFFQLSRERSDPSFFINLFVIIILGGVLSVIINLFLKKKFSKILLYTTIVVGTITILGGILTDKELDKRESIKKLMRLIEPSFILKPKYDHDLFVK